MGTSTMYMTKFHKGIKTYKARLGEVESPLHNK